MADAFQTTEAHLTLCKMAAQARSCLTGGAVIALRHVGLSRQGIKRIAGEARHSHRNRAGHWGFALCRQPMAQSAGSASCDGRAHYRQIAEGPAGRICFARRRGSAASPIRLSHPPPDRLRPHLTHRPGGLPCRPPAGALRAQEHNQTAFSRDDPQPCDICQMPAVAFSPGSEPVRTVVLLPSQHAPRRQWCAAHWPATLPTRVLP